MAEKKLHWYLASLQHENGGEGVCTFANSNMKMTRKDIKCIEKQHIAANNISGRCLVTHLTYLGKMTEEEFYAEE